MDLVLSKVEWIQGWQCLSTLAPVVHYPATIEPWLHDGIRVGKDIEKDGCLVTYAGHDERESIRDNPCRECRGRGSPVHQNAFRVPHATCSPWIGHDLTHEVSLMTLAHGTRHLKNESQAGVAIPRTRWVPGNSGEGKAPAWLCISHFFVQFPSRTRIRVKRFFHMLKPPDLTPIEMHLGHYGFTCNA